MDKLRREKDYTWIALSNATGVPVRTLQDISTRELHKDISQIGTGVKKRLLKLAAFWNMEYEDLFEPESDEEEESVEIEDMEKAFFKMKDHIERGDNITENAKRVYIGLLQERFLEGDFNTCIMNLLIADKAEINLINEKTVNAFVEKCKNQKRQNVVDSLAIKITDSRISYDRNILIYFALSFEENGFSDASEEIFKAISQSQENI